jgi:hypothetical protein
MKMIFSQLTVLFVGAVLAILFPVTQPTGRNELTAALEVGKVGHVVAIGLVFTIHTVHVAVAHPLLVDAVVHVARELLRSAGYVVWGSKPRCSAERIKSLDQLTTNTSWVGVFVRSVFAVVVPVAQVFLFNALQVLQALEFTLFALNERHEGLVFVAHCIGTGRVEDVAVTAGAHGALGRGQAQFRAFVVVVRAVVDSC